MELHVGKYSHLEEYLILVWTMLLLKAKKKISLA